MTMPEFMGRYASDPEMSQVIRDRMLKLLAQIYVEEHDPTPDREMSLGVVRDKLAHLCGHRPYEAAVREWPFIPGTRERR